MPGTEDLYAGAKLLGSATTEDGVATFEPPKQKGKKEPYEARFDGDDFYLGSSDQGAGKGGEGSARPVST